MRSDFSLGYLAARACPTAVASIAIGIIAGIVRLDSIPGGGDFSWHLRAARNLIAGAEIYSDPNSLDMQFCGVLVTVCVVSSLFLIREISFLFWFQ